MYKQSLIAIVLVASTLSSASGQNHTHRRRGVILGGLAGAAIGAAIGDKGNNETTGALIGGAVGAIAGGTIGNEKDARIEHNRIYHSAPPQHVHSYPTYTAPVYPHSGHPPYPSPSPYPGHAGFDVPPPGTIYQNRPDWQADSHYMGPLSPLDVVSMKRRGFSDASVVKRLQTYGITMPLSVRDIIGMHDQGVSEYVIDAMQVAPVMQSAPLSSPMLHGPQ
ncbi:secreted protein containing surface antigen domain protein [Rhodopirellula maiorica SM1]|uniref:Secreted protein containing surface antigen domain protein n=1 Tax=Rhodopirellula maiorica SM1 TaxID=1265738 RepID=M5RJY9_9BACT|nr:glycine zipper domain-containing protein [Rhodopirellula maiorica]EMI19643.1 secreted protein containing surface antigen domain protein [Rhodopirellula maiorica SM1]